MIRIIFIILFCLAMTACGNSPGYAPETRDLLKQLDATIREKAAIDDAKHERIDSVKREISLLSTDEERYAIYDKLYDEYYQYEIDSAITYARKKCSLAEGTLAEGKNPEQDKERMYDATLDLADRYVLSGMYIETMSLISQINSDELPYTWQARYFHICNAMYKGMAAASDDKLLAEEYRRKQEEFRERLYERIGPEDISRLYVRSEMMIDNGKARDIIDELVEKHSSPDLSIHEKAIISYMAAQACMQCGREDEAIALLAESAEHDLRTPVNEYKSLYELAALLYKKGDLDRAYNYIVRSVNDAMAANARVNIQSINNILPIITNSYNEMIKGNERQLRWILAIISCLALLLVITVRITLKDKKKIAEANDKLNEYVSLLQDSNSIKESYLGRYLDMCSDYIAGLERYRSMLKRSAKSGGYSEVMENLKSNEYIDKELADFYSRFDVTFLDLFPDFIKQLNLLLAEDKRYEDRSREGILSTELRVAALIRLGVNDSVKIAHFLRRSASTIYNYRVKMRNAALDRDSFEDQLMQIGRLKNS